MHLLGNMWFLWIFGNNVEDSMGRGRFVAFYLLCGLAAALLQVSITPDSGVPMVGASGAISGVMGGYVVLYPFVRVYVLIFLGFFLTSIALPAWTMVGYWMLIQILSGLVALGSSSAGRGGLLGSRRGVLRRRRPGQALREGRLRVRAPCRPLAAAPPRVAMSGGSAHFMTAFYLRFGSYPTPPSGYGFTASPRYFRYISSRQAKIGANDASRVRGAVYIGRIPAGKRKRSSGAGFTSISMHAVVTSARLKAHRLNTAVLPGRVSRIVKIRSTVTLACSSAYGECWYFCAK